MNTVQAILKLSFISIFIIFIGNNVYANDLGTMGETYSIVEIDFLKFIQERVGSMQKNGQWQAVQNRVQQDAISFRDRPKRVEGLTRANETKIKRFDPSIVLDHSVTTPEGKLIAPSGTHVNPLVYISLSKALIFFDGDDPEQVKWAINQNNELKGRTKLILVNGSVLELEKKFKKSIYFDQSGALTTRFNITHVPAIVTQDGMYLKIKEIAV